MATLARSAPCLWFDGRAEEAARFHAGTFDNSRVVGTSCYCKAGHEHHGMEPGSVLTVAFELDGMSFIALNGPPLFKFTEAVSFVPPLLPALLVEGARPADCGGGRADP